MSEKKINQEDMEMQEPDITSEEASNEEHATAEPQTRVGAPHEEPAPASEQEAGPTEEETPKAPLEEAQEEIAQLKDKYLRSVAEFDNYRKRTLKEKTELILNGSEKAVGAILPIVDDMERAIANNSKTDDPEALREGMQLIYNKFIKVLSSLGVKAIETEDALFDTDIHEAVAMVPGMGDDKKGKVIDCLLKGYKLNDKVIRHAQVAVGS